MRSEPPPLPPAPSGRPVLGNAVEYARDPFGFVDRAVRECGDVYRMDLPGVADVAVFVHPDHVGRALVDDVEAFGKTEDFRRAFGDGLLSVEGERWRRQRETLGPLFFRDRIAGYADAMVDCVERRVATWTPGETLDAEREMRDLTLEILFATLFGRELTPGDGVELRDAADGLNGWFTPTSWILPTWVPTPPRLRFRRSVERLRDEVRALRDDAGTGSGHGSGSGSVAGAGDGGPPDLLSVLSGAAAGDRKGGRDGTADATLPPGEVEDQLVTMVFAGHETTATLLAFAWYLLATHPEVRERFHRELATVLDGEPPTREDLSALTVTDRVVRETLRLYPPVHTIPRRTRVDVEADGYRIPAGREVHLSVFAIHRDGRWYDDPLVFRPDRWVDGFEDDLHDFAYLPFGAGRRTCIGREFALVEARLVLAAVGQRFRLDRTEGPTPELDPRVTLRTADGIPLRIRRR